MSDNAVVTLRPVGNPLPLGFLALAVTTTVFSAVQLGWLPAGQWTVAALTALLFAVPLQALAAVFGFLARDPVAGTGMGPGRSRAPRTCSQCLARPAPASARRCWLRRSRCSSSGRRRRQAGRCRRARGVVGAVHRHRHRRAHRLRRLAGHGGSARSCAGRDRGLRRVHVRARVGAGHAVLPLFRRNGAVASSSGEPPARLGDVGHDAGVRQLL